MSPSSPRWAGGSGPIGVLGGYGAVGRAAVHQLRAWGAESLLVAGRDRKRAQELIDELPPGAEAVEVDIHDAEALARFCSRCQVVINCAGPSSELLDVVARLALANGAHYIDAGGDDPVHGLLVHDEVPAAGQVAVLSAGMLPGLTGLLPRVLAAGFDEPTTLVGYVGGLDRFTVTAATDYAASLRNGFGRSQAAWRRGQKTERALTPMGDVELPYFRDPVSIHPYLSTEMERVAARLGLDEATFYNVFPGAQVRAALGQIVQGATAPERRGAEINDRSAVDLLVAASALDVFGRDPYQCLLFQLDGRHRGDEQSRTLWLSSRGASELTGTMAAITTAALTRGLVPPGVHFAADVVDPVDVVAQLRDAQAVNVLELMDGPIPSNEEGAL